MILCPQSLQCLTLRCCIRSPEPPRIRHVMLLHVFSCTPTHTSCYAVTGSVKVLHVRHDDDGDDDDAAAAARLFSVGVRSSGRWCLYWPVPRCIDGFYTGLSPGVLTVLFWPVPKFAQAMSMFRGVGDP